MPDRNITAKLNCVTGSGGTVAEQTCKKEKTYLGVQAHFTLPPKNAIRRALNVTRLSFLYASVKPVLPHPQRGFGVDVVPTTNATNFRLLILGTSRTQLADTPKV